MARIALDQALRDWGVSGAELARGLRVSEATISLIRNQDRWPKTPGPVALRNDMERWLKDRLSQDDIYPTPREMKGLWREVAPSRRSKDQPGEAPDQSERNDMLPKKERLSKDAMTHFKLFASPFGDVEKDEQMYLGPEYRQHRERILSVMRSGGMLAIVGQSGSGKTTLFEDCEQCARTLYPEVQLIKPPIIGRDEAKEKGSPLRAAELMRLIVTKIDEHAKPKHKLFDLYGQLETMLMDRSAQRFCFYVDDAHRVSDLTVFRDFYNIKSGRRRLLSIVMFGQQRLGSRLNPYSPDAYHVTQHCEVTYLQPLDQAGLRDYLKTRFSAAGADVAKVLADDAYEALIAKLAKPVTDGSKTTLLNQAYPLAVGNLLIRAMNACTDPDLPAALVTAEIVKEV